MSAHTPGPWSIQDSIDGITKITGGLKYVARIMGRLPSDDANAQLIAAAPDLLKALKWFVDNDDTNIGMDGNEFWENGLNAGKAAIAKATGANT